MPPCPPAWNLRVLGRLPHGPRPCRPAWYPTSAPGCLATAPRVTFRLVATMATMATPRGPTSKKKSHAGYQLVVYHPLHLSLAFFFSRFNLGVAMVAMVAMTREPPQRPRKPRPVREDAACRRCGARDAPSARGTGTLEHGRRAATPGGHQSWTNPTNLQRYPTSAPGCLATAPRVDFWPVATMATMATPAGQPLKKSRLAEVVGWLSSHPPLASFFKSFQLGVAMVAMVASKLRSLSFLLRCKLRRSC